MSPFMSEMAYGCVMCLVMLLVGTVAKWVDDQIFDDLFFGEKLPAGAKRVKSTDGKLMIKFNGFVSRRKRDEETTNLFEIVGSHLYNKQFCNENLDYFETNGALTLMELSTYDETLRSTNASDRPHGVDGIYRDKSIGLFSTDRLTKVDVSE